MNFQFIKNLLAENGFQLYWFQTETDFKLLACAGGHTFGTAAPTQKAAIQSLYEKFNQLISDSITELNSAQ